MKHEQEWIIGIGGSQKDNISFHRFIGNEDSLQEVLAKMVARDKELNEDAFKFGTLSAFEVEIDREEGGYYAYGYYDGYHLDYKARPLDEVPVVKCIA